MKRTNTLPYFQLDSGQVLLASLGRSDEEMGLYLKLMAMYWEGDCRLPFRDTLVRKLGVKGKKLAVLELVLEDFFPDGVHEQLDLCRDIALKTSERQSANARKGHAQRGNPQEISRNLQAPDSDPGDF